MSQICLSLFLYLSFFCVSASTFADDLLSQMNEDIVESRNTDVDLDPHIKRTIPDELLSSIAVVGSGTPRATFKVLTSAKIGQEISFVFIAKSKFLTVREIKPFWKNFMSSSIEKFSIELINIEGVPLFIKDAPEYNYRKSFLVKGKIEDVYRFLISFAKNEFEAELLSVFSDKSFWLHYLSQEAGHEMYHLLTKSALIQLGSRGLIETPPISTSVQRWVSPPETETIDILSDDLLASNDKFNLFKVIVAKFIRFSYEQNRVLMDKPYFFSNPSQTVKFKGRNLFDGIHLNHGFTTPVLAKIRLLGLLRIKAMLAAVESGGGYLRVKLSLQANKIKSATLNRLRGLMLSAAYLGEEEHDFNTFIPYIEIVPEHSAMKKMKSSVTLEDIINDLSKLIDQKIESLQATDSCHASFK